MKISDLANSCDIQKLYLYFPEQGWVKVFLNDRDEFEERQVGTGFAIKVKEDCLLGQQEVEVGAPPAIPE